MRSLPRLSLRFALNVLCRFDNIHKQVDSSSIDAIYPQVYWFCGRRCRPIEQEGRHGGELEACIDIEGLDFGRLVLLFPSVLILENDLRSSEDVATNVAHLGAHRNCLIELYHIDCSRRESMEQRPETIREISGIHMQSESGGTPPAAKTALSVRRVD